MGPRRQPDKARDTDAFDAFVAAHSRQLLRAGWLLCGDWALAQDLVQTTLTSTWTSWDRVSAADHPEAYVRRSLVNAYLSAARRRSFHEQPTEQPTETRGYDAHGAAELRIVLSVALGALPSQPPLSCAISMTSPSPRSPMRCAARRGRSRATSREPCALCVGFQRWTP
ncbi:MAG: polymerase subunit sigma-24 [Pseudonocardiales bacterium]|nr:polymerase subunit sigma-24 [Pseudonocardiales bacterium]